MSRSMLVFTMVGLLLALVISGCSSVIIGGGESNSAGEKALLSNGNQGTPGTPGSGSGNTPGGNTGGGSTGPDGSGNGSFGSSFGITLQPNQDIGLFTVESPTDATVNEFTIHGTIPLPPGIYPQANGKNPFFIEDAGGAKIPMQVEPVSSYPNEGQDGYDVVELIGRVKVKGNNFQTYRVYSGEATNPQPPANATARTTLLQGPEFLPPHVANFLTQQSAIELVAYDHEGIKHSRDLLDSSNGNVKVEKYGPYWTTVRNYGLMLPQQAGGSLKHFLGAHSFTKTIAHENVILVDLLLNNGPAGENANNMPLGVAHPEAIGIQLPPGWVVMAQFDNPFIRSCNSHPTLTSSYPCPADFFPLVDAINNLDNDDNAFFTSQDGDLHVMPPQANMALRLAIVPDIQSAKDRARALLDQEGHAFATRGNSQALGVKLFSWWNDATARAFPQKILLPSFDFYGINTLRNKIKNNFNTIKNLRSSGGKNSGALVFDKNMGWAHPYDQKGGGGTGGTNLQAEKGSHVLAAASRHGVLDNMLHLEMVLHRQAKALYKQNGEPYDPWDYKETDAQGLMTQTYKNFWMGPWSPNFKSPSFPPQSPGDPAPPYSDDAFGYTASLINKPNIGSKKPGYSKNLIGDGTCYSCEYSAYDQQHYGRFLRFLSGLTWSSNDPLAKMLLVLQGALAMGTYNYTPFNKNSMENHQELSMVRKFLVQTNQYPKSGNAAFNVNAQKNMLLALQQGNPVNPPSGFTNQGIGHGRAEAWGLFAASGAYSVADSAWRAKNLPWFEVETRHLDLGISQCSGLLLSQRINKTVDTGLIDESAQYMLQMFEEGLNHHALMALWRSVWHNANASYANKTENILDSSVRKGMFTSAWSVNKDKPWYLIGLSDMTPSYLYADNDFHYFGSGAPPAACSGAVVPPGTDAPLHPSHPMSQNVTETAYNAGAGAYGYYVATDHFFIEKSAKMLNINTAGKTTVQLANDLVTKIQTTQMVASQFDKFNWSNHIPMLAIAQHIAGII